MVALVVFAAVAVVVGLLVDVLARRGVQVARARAEATGLARLLAERLAADTNALPEAAGALRRIFDLDSVAVLRASDGEWVTQDSVGAPVPRDPGQAQFTIELADRRVLALTGSRLAEEDAELLQALLAAMRQAHEREQSEEFTADRTSPQ